MSQSRFRMPDRRGGPALAVSALRRSDRPSKMFDSRLEIRIRFCPLSGPRVIESVRGVLHEGCGITASALLNSFLRFPYRLREMFRRQRNTRRDKQDETQR